MIFANPRIHRITSQRLVTRKFIRQNLPLLPVTTWDVCHPGFTRFDTQQISHGFPYWQLMLICFASEIRVNQSIHPVPRRLDRLVLRFLSFPFVFLLLRDIKKKTRWISMNPRVIHRFVQKKHQILSDFSAWIVWAAITYGTTQLPVLEGAPRFCRIFRHRPERVDGAHFVGCVFSGGLLR